MKKTFPRTNLKKRTSTIANAMVHSIVYLENIKDDYEEWLGRFSQIPGEEKCVYCGAPATSVDHVFNLVKDGMPTGYNTEKNNLVPCCSTCNSKKGSKSWLEFIETPHFKSFKEYEARTNLLRSVLDKYPPKFVNFKEVLGTDFKRFVGIKNKLNDDLNLYDKELSLFRQKVEEYFKNSVVKHNLK